MRIDLRRTPTVLRIAAIPAVAVAVLALRFNWNSPFFLSPHNPSVVYFGGNRVLKSNKRGEELQIISPDMSKGLTAKLEAAELRCTDARASVKELESKLAAARKELDEAQEALTFLDSLTEAPFSVIRAVLG
jgi:hypothetical protein